MCKVLKKMLALLLRRLVISYENYIVKHQLSQEQLEMKNVLKQLNTLLWLTVNAEETN